MAARSFPMVFVSTAVPSWVSALPGLFVLALLVGSLNPWYRAWRWADGTALRGALVWAVLALSCGILAQIVALFELRENGKPVCGVLTYVMTLAALAGLISVLNARVPGGGAWAVLMVLLLVVFCIPLLESAGRVRGVAGAVVVVLDSPWTIFYGLLVLMGVTNFLPTRYGPAAVVLGIGFALEYLVLTRTEWPAGWRAQLWTVIAGCLAVAVRLCRHCAQKEIQGRDRLECQWIWFRDHWGVVWGLRIQDRFNRTAASSQWPIRLSWFGLTWVNGNSSVREERVPDVAEATFRGLIRRFVDSERLDRALAEASRSGACQGQGR